jgi:monoamine oxidase
LNNAVHKKSVTRRSFLQQVGVTGGGGAMFAMMGALGVAPAARAETTPYVPPSAGDLSLSDRGKPRVLILGGGVAGLATAYELGKAGYACHILEAMDRTGGRAWTVRRGARLRETDGKTQVAQFAEGQYLNAGPARIAQWMVTLDYCRELRVPIEPFINTNHDAYYYVTDSGPLSNRPIRKRTAMADTYGYVAELLAKATDQGALDQMLTANDKANLLDFLSGWGAIGGRVDQDPDKSWLYTGGSRRGWAKPPGAGTQQGVPLGPVPSLSDVLASHTGSYFGLDDYEVDMAMAMYQPVGGMDRLAAALADRVGRHRITTGAVVTRVNTYADHVEVLYRHTGGREQRMTAEFCVATLPPYLMAKVPHNLGAEVTAALAGTTGYPSGKIGLEYRRRWWEEDHRIYGGITRPTTDVEQIWYPSGGYLGSRGIVVGYYHEAPSIAVRYGKLSPAERTKRAVAQGEQIHGKAYRTDLVSSFSVEWHKVPFLQGAWADWSQASSGAFKKLLEPAGRVYFAGDWLTPYIGWQAGALESARAASAAVHKRVMSG